MSDPTLQRFVADLVSQLDPEARLTDFSDAAGWYSLRIEIPGEAGKDVVLPARMVRNALTQPSVERTLRALLQAHLATIRARRAVGEAQQTRTETSRGLPCAVCHRTITDDDSVVFAHGEILHRHCR